MLPGAIHHPCLPAKSLFLPDDGSQGTTNTRGFVPNLSWHPPATIDAILHLSFWISLILKSILAHCLQINSSASTSNRPIYVTHVKQHFFPPLLPWKTQRPSFLSLKQQFHQLYSVFHRCKSLLPWPGSTNSSILLKEVVIFFPIRKKH